MSLNSDIPVAEVDLGPGISAFFTTCAGGVSTAAYASLNLGSRVGDDESSVAANRHLLNDAVGGMPIVYGKQVHADGVYVVTPQVVDLLDRVGDLDVAADALVSVHSGMGVAAYVADCVPILLADCEQGVIASVHAGRPGLEAGVIGAAIEAMLAQGAHLTTLRAAVGPCICALCYEVPDEMAREFARITGTETSLTKWQSVGIDLRAAAHVQLRDRGIGKIIDVAECTYEHAERGRLFSHRWATHNSDITAGKSGRIAGVVIRESAE